MTCFLRKGRFCIFLYLGAGVGGSHRKISAVCLFLEQSHMYCCRWLRIFCRMSQPRVSALHQDDKLQMKAKITHFSVCVYFRGVSSNDFSALETLCKKIMKEKQAFERLEVKKETLLEMFKVGCYRRLFLALCKYL